VKAIDVVGAELIDHQQHHELYARSGAANAAATMSAATATSEIRRIGNQTI
jgi:hypothetical protein